jgi:hypothetical protein
MDAASPSNSDANNGEKTAMAALMLGVRIRGARAAS